MKYDLSTTSLGIELGSTRIKAVLCDEKFDIIAEGVYDWENILKDGIWSYEEEEMTLGVRGAFAKLKSDYETKYGEKLDRVGAMGISAMMHGYIALDENDGILVPFRTWRNTVTEEDAALLTDLFDYNIPQRWSVAHLHRAARLGEEHLSSLRRVTTLAGYIHYKLTGERCLGVGDASGMFPIDSKTNTYDEAMVQKFDSHMEELGYAFKLRELFPKVLCAGECAGYLTEDGAAWLDPTGDFSAGIPFCPPEGDAGTGMVATNSIAPRTGNISAGTSVFSMTVLEKPLSKVYPEIDMVTTPDGSPVAMVHCNTCTSDLDFWVSMFGEFAALCGFEITKNELYSKLYGAALDGKSDCAGAVSYNCYSGEPVIGLTDGAPAFSRKPGVRFTLPDFMRTLLSSSMAPLKLGMDILMKKENAAIDSMLGHGGIFKTPHVAQKLMASSLGIPVSVMKTAGEGGPWGMAILAAYSVRRCGLSLSDFLSEKVFASSEKLTEYPDEEDSKGFDIFLENYMRCLPAESHLGKSI